MSASVKLWIVSASRATEPVKITTISCTTAVAASRLSETHVARTPCAVASNAESAEPKCSCRCSWGGS